MEHKIGLKEFWERFILSLSREQLAILFPVDDPEKCSLKDYSERRDFIFRLVKESYDKSQVATEKPENVSHTAKSFFNRLHDVLNSRKSIEPPDRFFFELDDSEFQNLRGYSTPKSRWKFELTPKGLKRLINQARMQFCWAIDKNENIGAEE